MVVRRAETPVMTVQAAERGWGRNIYFRRIGFHLEHNICTEQGSWRLGGWAA